MFEDNSYEPIAEIYLTFSEQPSLDDDDIYCLCSRVFVEGVNKEEEVQEGAASEGEVAEEVGHIPQLGQSGENTVRFCNSSTESQPVPTPILKKSNEEAVSCYCSASHYSTDEHDSLRDSSVLHHSDSGADLSESSRDLDWERYWTLHGERLIWESWISKYGTYIDPSYFTQTNNVDHSNNTQQPADGDNASFCIQSETAPDPNRKTSFAGLLDSVRTGADKPSDLYGKHSSVEDEKPEDNITPQILVENIRSDVDDLLNRRLSDISETYKSLSGKSEDSSNFDDNDKLRLSVFSRCSGSSAPLSATTDSMTNVTRITLSSSDSSYGVEDSSAKSSSILSSSDSGSSADQQWQVLWADHFNEQYNYHYKKFTQKLSKKRDCGEDVKSDSGLIIDESKLSINRHSDTQHQESIDDVGSIETQDSVSEGEHSKPPSVTGSSKSSSKSEQSKTYNQRQRVLSVGYLLQQLNAMSVEPIERIQEEEKSVSLSRPSTMESVQNVNANGKCNEQENECSKSVKNDCTICDQVDSVETGIANNVFRDSNDELEKENVPSQMDSINCEDDAEISGEAAMQADSDESNVRHGIKRSHESEIDESSVEKVKNAYQLMGFMYDMENTKKIRKASVWYKKRFSQIRFQNRILRLQKAPNKHIYFDDDDEVSYEPSQLVSPVPDDIEEKNDSLELFVDATETAVPQIQPYTQGYVPSHQGKLEMEEFSEKDDSTDDDQEVFFSAEEDNLDSNQDRRESKFRGLPKRRRKRQLKKKSLVSYPQEMIDNPKIKKFWHRRYSLFSKFDEGIKMDAESWYSVTPEKIAVNIAERCRCDLVVDAFCGAGGNAIQLAFTCERVIAIDIDPHKIELARNNARVYGVEDRIEFIVGDYLQLVHCLAADVVFMSPPWGGPSYSKRGVFSLSDLQPVSGQKLYELTSAITDNIAFYLPKNINTQELVECAGPGGCVEVVQNFLDRELVAVTTYFGELVNAVE